MKLRFTRNNLNQGVFVGADPCAVPRRMTGVYPPRALTHRLASTLSSRPLSPVIPHSMRDPGLFQTGLFSHQSPVQFRQASWSDLNIPQEQIDELYRRSEERGHEQTLFSYDNGYDPIDYEIREGTPDRSDATTLGEKHYSEAEEKFFGTTALAHIHPSEESFLPSEQDIKYLIHLARLNPEKEQIHTLFGYHDDKRVFVHMRIFGQRVVIESNRAELSDLKSAIDVYLQLDEQAVDAQWQAKKNPLTGMSAAEFSQAMRSLFGAEARLYSLGGSIFVNDEKNFTWEGGPTEGLSGRQILLAVAKFELESGEHPDLEGLTATKAYHKLGAARLWQILHEKYLGRTIEKSDWNEKPEKFAQAMRTLFGAEARLYSLGGSIFVNDEKNLTWEGGPTEGVSGYQILMAVAKFELESGEHPDLEELTVTKAYHKLGAAKLWQILHEKYLGLKSFTDYPTEEFADFIGANYLGSLLDSFGDSGGDLIEMLSFLRPDAFENRDIAEFVKRYAGLRVEGKGRGGRGRGKVEFDEKREQYIAAILQAIADGQNLDLSETNFQRLLALFIQLCRKSYEKSAEALLKDLEKKAASHDHPFLKRLHEEAYKHFKKNRDLKVVNMTTAPYGYQREGIFFLSNRRRGLLTDAAGLGKTIQGMGAAEVVGAKRILWVTTASNRENVRDEILEHSTNEEGDISIIISGDPVARHDQVRSLNDSKYRITNYETLVRLKKDDPEGYDLLTSNLDVLIVDEAQAIDNPKTQRSQAVRSIEAKFIWGLTATPYQSQLRRFWVTLNWLDAERFPDWKIFEQKYLQDTEGLRLLKDDTRYLMLRRRKRDTVEHFESPDVKPYQEQLADGMPRVPKLVRRDGDNLKYEMSWEQADLYAWMVADFEGWAVEFNQLLPNGADPINLDTINPLMKFQYLQRVIYDPEHFGIDMEPGYIGKLKELIAEDLAEGDKFLAWGWNTSVLDRIEGALADRNMVRIDGKIVGTRREAARNRLQNDERVDGMVANYLSGGVGLTLTAARHAYFIQLPDSAPKMNQAEGRHQRLIGMNNLKHAKHEVYSHWLQAVLPAGFLDTIEDEKLKVLLARGTLVEQTVGRLEGGAYLYNLVMDGYGKMEDLEEYFRDSLIQSMSLNSTERLNYTPKFHGVAKRYAQVAQAILPLWERAKGTRLKSTVLRLIHETRHNLNFAKRLGEVFTKHDLVDGEDLRFILSVFEISNKYIRQQVLKFVPTIMDKYYANGKTLSEEVNKLELGRLTPTTFLSNLYLANESEDNIVLDISKELANGRDDPKRRYLEEHFYMGLLGLMENEEAKLWLEINVDEISQLTLSQQILLIYQLGLLSRARPDLVDELGDNLNSINEGCKLAVADFADREVSEVDAMLNSTPSLNNRIDPLLSLMVGCQSTDDNRLIDQYREVLSHVIDGDLESWRLGENDREYGDGIDYLSETPEFWKRFSQTDKTTIDSLTISPKGLRESLIKLYKNILAEHQLERVEGDWLSVELESYRNADRREQAATYERYKGEITILSQYHYKGVKTEETQALLEKSGLTNGSNELTHEMRVEGKIEELKNLLSWMRIEDAFRKIERGEEVDKKKLVLSLENKGRLYQRRRHEKMAMHLSQLKEKVLDWQDGERHFKDITIEDRSDSGILLRMGCLNPEMQNCFNVNGNPIFNQFLVTALASKHIRLITVKENGKIIATGLLKVKQDEDDNPVLFLETGLFRRGYDFTREMLEHIAKKSASMDPAPVVMQQIPGKAKEDDPTVYGIGAYTENEYVETVFGWRAASRYKHKGRVYDRGSVGNLMGLGTSNLSIENFIAELKGTGVEVVVDVRANPMSRFRPHFNRERLKNALEAEGIGYVWMGDALGNPKDENGERTLDGFKKYMQTEKYANGRESLLELMSQHSGNIVLICAEKDENQCHRKLILEDIRTT
ncbi:MAG: DUF488 family protein [Pseudomonadota bacterium]